MGTQHDIVLVYGALVAVGCIGGMVFCFAMAWIDSRKAPRRRSRY